MKLVPAIFLALAMSLACSSPTKPESRATYGAMATATVPATLAATPTATAAAVPTATITATAIATATAPPTAMATATVAATLAATLTATATAAPTVTTPPSAVAAPRAEDPFVLNQLPLWVEESPKMAWYIAASDVIAKAKLVSLDSITQQHPHWGYIAELIYKFEVVQYLKGNGDDTLVVHLSSGPKYVAFPDWLGLRTESEAHELAREWLNRRIQTDRDKGDSILLLLRSPQEETYLFRGADRGQGSGGHPILGETWLVEHEPSMYRHQFTEGGPSEISLSDVNHRIEDMQRLMELEHSACVRRTLLERSRVRERILGTYQELTLGGYRNLKEFPRFTVTVDSEGTADAYVFKFLRPPNESPRFSDYWLDGKDRDKFSVVARADAKYTTEGLRALRVLPPGTYSVHYSQFHMSLPCDQHSYGDDNAWWVSDTTEWIVNVTAPGGSNG